MDHIAVDRLECAACRAVHEREAHDDGCDDRRTPGKDERQVDGEQGTPDGTALPKKVEEEESDDGRRQDERQGNHGVGDRAREAAADLQDTIGKSDADEEGDDRRKTRNLQ